MLLLLHGHFLQHSPCFLHEDFCAATSSSLWPVVPYCFLPINTLTKLLPVAAFLFWFEQCCVSVRAVEERMLEIFAVKWSHQCIWINICWNLWLMLLRHDGALISKHLCSSLIPSSLKYWFVLLNICFLSAYYFLLQWSNLSSARVLYIHQPLQKYFCKLLSSPIFIFLDVFLCLTLVRHVFMVCSELGFAKRFLAQPANHGLSWESVGDHSGLRSCLESWMIRVLI